jgi:hypothetical protein
MPVGLVMGVLSQKFNILVVSGETFGWDDNESIEIEIYDQLLCTSIKQKNCGCKKINARLGNVLLIWRIA